MPTNIESLLLNQEELLKLLNKAYTNYCKSPKARISQSYIETRTEALESLFQNFKDNHTKIVSGVNKSEQTELSYFTEDLYEQFEERYFDYKTKMKDDLKACNKTSISSNCEMASALTSPSHCEVRLPQINLPRFSGGYEEWQSFHDMFLSLIHNNVSLSSVQKLHYLKSCLHGEADYVLKNLSTTETNYNEAWMQLTRRYNNKRFNTNEVLKRLFSQKIINSESASAIKHLLDTTSACLKSLSNLNIDTSSWDAIINHLVVSKLDQESRKQWEHQLSLNDSDEIATWAQLKKFMETRFRTIEMLEGGKASSRTVTKSFHSAIEEKKGQTLCGMCNGQHLLYQCKQFAKYTPQERSNYVQANRLCFNCLAPNHTVNRCHQSTSCRRCGRRHHSLLHMEREKSEIVGIKNDSRDSLQSNTQPKQETNIVSNFSRNISPCDVLLATAVVRVKSACGSSFVIRALIDQGSQASFITEATVQLLGLKRTPINGLVSGVGDGHTRVKYIVSLQIQSRHHSNKSISVNAFVLSTLTSMLPSRVVHSPDWLELEELPLADPGFKSPSKIDVLLGAEVYGEIIKSGIIKNPTRNLIAQDTVFGWIISGKVLSRSTSAQRVISMHTQVREDDLLKQFWELEKEPETNMKMLTNDELRCEEIFNSSTTRDKNGRFIVRLPFKTSDPQSQYGQSLQIATRRFMSLERKLSNNPRLREEYAKVIDEYKILNHLRLVPENDVNNPKAVYLPHHAVVREDRDTTKVRVVFDASCKGLNNVSLNDDLLVGPKLQLDLRHLLLKWREHRICIIADLVKMYRQVLVHEEDINYQRILWRPTTGEPLKHYQLLTLTFGTACAPYLAVKALHRLAEEEDNKCPVAANIIKNDLYMDDLMTCCENEEEAIKIYEELNKLMKMGGFQFQKWSSNSENVLEYMGKDMQKENKSVSIKVDETVKILGLNWNRAEDTFEYEIKLHPLEEPVTKRKVVSDISRLFDPLGLVAPIITTAKVFIQKLWLSGIEWDQALPESLLREWLTYRAELTMLSAYKIPRWIGRRKGDKRVELQGFCDASNIAYAAVVYTRVIDEQGAVTVTLITSKTKVAPVKQVSVPRLELCGAVLLAKLLLEVSRVLNISKEEVYAWTDSSVVLAWLSSHPSKWKTFVANRVSEILTIMDSSKWSYVKSKDNPADCASRGIDARSFLDLELWKKGPSWLEEKDIIYSKGDFKSTVLEERTNKTVCLTTHLKGEGTEEFIERFSSLIKMLQIGSYCRRVLDYKLWRDRRQKRPEFITVEEMDNTLHKLISLVQDIHFKEEILQIQSNSQVFKRSKLHTLCPILDPKGILRVGGRIDRSELSYDQKHPVILPDKSNLTKLIISNAHYKTLHGGPQIMINHIKQKYYVIKLRAQVKAFYRSCVTCRKYSSANRTPLMGQIPEARLKPSKPFKSTGVDYAGPINIRFSPGRGSKAYKGYLCLFVCMVTRAVHLEAVSDLSAKGFIAAFRRFTARRGHCQDLFSDNGTNFVGSSKQLIKMFKNANSGWPNEIVQLLTLESTTWHFIPPHAPNFGGLWEAGVRSVKNHLKKVIADTTLTFEELSTVLTQIEACLNSRPISVLSDDPCDPLPLTPGHFLVGEPLINIIDKDYCNVNISALDRWKLCQKMVCNFWKRWSSEYIVSLNHRYKWNRKVEQPNVNDVVVIRDDNVPPAKWVLGKIIETYPGPDNITRVVKIKCKNGMLKRPVSKICVLTK